MLDGGDRELGLSRVYPVWIVHRCELNKLVRINPRSTTLPELSVYLIGEGWVKTVENWCWSSPALGRGQLVIVQEPSPRPRGTPEDFTLDFLLTLSPILATTQLSFKRFGDGTKIDTRRFWGIRFNVSAYAIIKKTYPTIVFHTQCNDPDDLRLVSSYLQFRLDSELGIPVYRVQIVHRAFLNQLFKTNPTQPELAFYLIGKYWVWHVHFCYNSVKFQYFWMRFFLLGTANNSLSCDKVSAKISFFGDSEKLCGLFGPYTREARANLPTVEGSLKTLENWCWQRPRFPVSCLPCSTLSHRSGAIIGSRDKPLAELQIKEKTIWVTSAIPTRGSKQPIETLYLGSVPGLPLIIDLYMLLYALKTIWVTSAIPTDTSKQPIRTRYLGHVTGNQPIRNKGFLIYLVPGSRDKA
eukprot:sb/3479403/